MGTLTMIAKLVFILVAGVIAIIVWAMFIAALKADELSDFTITWALMQTARIAPDPLITQFGNESSCEIARSFDQDQGVTAFCVPVLVKLPQPCEATDGE